MLSFTGNCTGGAFLDGSGACCSHITLPYVFTSNSLDSAPFGWIWGFRILIFGSPTSLRPIVDLQGMWKLVSLFPEAIPRPSLWVLQMFFLFFVPSRNCFIFPYGSLSKLLSPSSFPWPEQEETLCPSVGWEEGCSAVSLCPSLWLQLPSLLPQLSSLWLQLLLLSSLDL